MDVPRSLRLDAEAWVVGAAAVVAYLAVREYLLMFDLARMLMLSAGVGIGVGLAAAFGYRAVRRLARILWGGPPRRPPCPPVA